MRREEGITDGETLKMGSAVDSLCSALGVGDREQIALVGGGGKTSLMFSLVEELVSKGMRVVTGTTTRVLKSEAKRAPCVIFLAPGSDLNQTVRPLLEKHGQVFVGRDLSRKGKILGISPSDADLLYREPWINYLILESDGSAGLPVKAPAEHEPVIPESSSLVVALMGLEALGVPFEESLVFRAELFESLTGLKRGESLSSEVIARVFLSPMGLFKGTPISARRIVFLNKLDLIPDDEDARRLANLLLADPFSGIETVVIGSLAKGVYFRARRA